MMRNLMRHFNLPLYCEGSLGPKYRCKICGALLRTERSEKTNWQEWLYDIKTGKRHFKTKCKEKQ